MQPTPTAQRAKAVQHVTLVTSFLWLLALLLVAWTLWQLPLASIASTLRALDFSLWPLWLALNISILILASLRWALLCRSLQAPLTTLQLLPLRQAGSMVSFVTPGPHIGGEPLQIYWLHRRYGLRLPTAVLSLGLDRSFELFTNIGVLLTAVLALLFTSSVSETPWGALAGLLASVLIALSSTLFFILRKPQWLTQRFSRMAQRWQQHPRLQQLSTHWQSLEQQLRLVLKTQQRTLGLAFLISLLSWLLLLSELALLLHWLNIPVEPQSFLCILVAMRLAMLLPTPGGLGSVEAALLWAFNLLHLPTSAALGVIALMRLRDAALLVLGLFCFVNISRQTSSQPLQ